MPRRYIKDDQGIPLSILKNAKGIAFVTVVKAGFVFSGTVGSGIVIAKLEDGTWSGPSSLGVAGMGWGALIGGSVTDSILVLNTKMAVTSFTGNGQVKFGGNVSVAVGPVGREADAAVTAGDKGLAACYSYSHSRGAFAGLSLQGAVMATRHSDNEQFYGRKVTARDILRGTIQPPPNDDLNLLYSTLNTIITSKNVAADVGASVLHRSGGFDPMVNGDAGATQDLHGGPAFPYATSENGAGGGGGAQSSAAAYGGVGGVSQGHVNGNSSGALSELPAGWTEVTSDGG
jgi:lipid-binding SYLF domain-containing protein